MTIKDKDITDAIRQPYKIPELILDGKYSKTSHFLVPGLHIEHRVKNFHDFFVNAFINDECKEHIVRNPVFVLARTKEFDAKWKIFSSEMKSSPRCIYEYDVGVYAAFNLVMFLFEFSPAYKQDYQTFLEGKYSQFSSPYKELFKEIETNAHGKARTNPFYGVINKTTTFKKQLEKVLGESIEDSFELWEKWSPDREIFRKQI